MNIILRSGLAVAPLLVLASSLVHPSGHVKDQRSIGPLLSGVETSSAVAAIFERACQNCHSERTNWPWYSYVAPFSWLMEGDVAAARSHMNLSRWGTYTAEQQVELLTKMGVEVRNRRMPLPRYLQLHPEARLSVEDVQQLYSWAHRERRRVRTVIDAKAKAATD